jgi:formate dehydrogenase subunit gamma
MTEDIERFTPAERSLHWTTALATMLLLGTGALIWRDLDKWKVAGFKVVEMAHIWVGGLLLVAGILTYLMRQRRRIPHADKRFNLGQRLSLAASRLVFLVIMATGGTLVFRNVLDMAKPFRKMVKQIHFWSASAIAAFILAHLVMVLLVPKNRGLLRGMLTGRVARPVATRVSPEWVAALDRDGGQAADDAVSAGEAPSRR